ncbi:hypothetical protein AMTRI_Chr13g83610 [Amborella trichopoda]|uniref:NADP-dependent oxidoreductase domain-containing protein n=1 Tax=Amborella trichopoda TaxID=13333 RepID=W1NYN6_AMBTC|nr:aldo-keto reductase family 4 member C9 [Amborella trichopoda]ERN00753.1 hypothetical protein AMTR_s00106p00131020 [Amborella trichopoda]|eukprot:XP_006838184.1 aldo-keto reductase family 4 member C9 [Amborella trichopoda]
MKAPAVRLSSGRKLPLIALGTAGIPYHSQQIQTSISLALKIGYRHFDTAKIYGSEPAIGKALNEAFDEGIVKREEVFVTSKLWCSDHHDPGAALKRTLHNLKLEYLDLYLVHWPVRFKEGVCYAVPKEDDFERLDMEQTWHAMEKCVELGLCHSIGISNFSSKKIEDLLSHASIPPAVNQVELHPLWRQHKLREFCAERKIHLSAYSPLGGPGSPWGSKAVIKNPTIVSIAHKHQRTPAQIALRWALESGVSVVAKSFNEERMQENWGVSDWVLDAEDHCKINDLSQMKFMRGDFLVNNTTSPYKTIEELWDGEI